MCCWLGNILAGLRYSLPGKRPLDGQSMGHPARCPSISAGMNPEARCMLGEFGSVRIRVMASQVDRLTAALVTVVVLGRKRWHLRTGGWNSIHVEGQCKSYCLEHTGDFFCG